MERKLVIIDQWRETLSTTNCFKSHTFSPSLEGHPGGLGDDLRAGVSLRLPSQGWDCAGTAQAAVQAHMLWSAFTSMNPQVFGGFFYTQESPDLPWVGNNKDHVVTEQRWM